MCEELLPRIISGVLTQDGDIYPLKTLIKFNLPAFTINPYPAFDSVGAKVIMACRDMDRAQAAVKDVMERSGNQNIVCMKLDLADSKSIREFAEAVNQGLTSLSIRDPNTWSGWTHNLSVLLSRRRAQTGHPHQQRWRDGVSVWQNCRRLWDADRCQSLW